MPPASKAAQISCEPYDVISSDEARDRSQGNPLSFLHVIRSEIDLPNDTDPHDARVYRQASDNLQSWIDNGHLVQCPEPGIFIYRQIFEGREQYGIVCCYDVQHYRDNEIRKHEKTRPVKEDDRTRHLTTCGAHAEPVFLTFKDDRAIGELIRTDTAGKPMIDFVAEDDVTHTIWRVGRAEDYVRAFERLDCVYIADGHHRTAAGERAATQRQSENPEHTGDEEYNRVLSVMFPAGQLKILAYNRVVSDLNGLTNNQFLARLAEIGTVQKTDDTEPQRAGTVCVYIGGCWHEFQFSPAAIDSNDPINSLDVALLQSRILTPILAVGDPRTDERIGFVGGIRGTAELERLVDSGDQAVAFSMFPTSLQQLIDVSDAGKIMPPKSTWFEPKLRSGLFVHRFENFQEATP